MPLEGNAEMDRLGIDIGSKTLKLMLLDENGRELFSSYEKHHGRIGELLQESIRSMIWHLGDRDVRISVAGSSGMRIAELFRIPFVQEVVALKRAVLELYPNADAVLEMGGEDTKLIYLSGTPEQRMNNVCAGGTGSFIEMMGGLMGERTTAIDRLAMGHTTIYPIASRCAVFAKSDVRPLMNAGARNEDIAASILDAVCIQAIAGLSAGRPLAGTVILLGGPFQYISSLRESFCRVSGFDREHAIVPENAHLFVARGAALSGRASESMLLSEFLRMLECSVFENKSGIERLRPLFETEEDLEAFRMRHSKSRVPRVTWSNADTDLFLGVDAGSTTAKIALIDSTGALIDYDYHRHRGDVVGSLTRMMNRILQHLDSKYTIKRVVRRSCAVGYGEELCRAAFGIDDGEVETVAHLRAALAIDPEVDFLMDIGGQDVKCFYVSNGSIQDVVLNEACSSGCGSLFDSVSNSLNKNRRDFVSEAMRSKAPVDLGTRCTTFMNSRIRHALKEGVSSEDIAAGVCYATVRNALFKVVRQPDFSKVGKHVVVQGGAFGNDALLRAFELETGTEVSRPDLAPIMAAWGAALLARDNWLTLKKGDPELASRTLSGLVSLDTMNNTEISKNVVRCDGCTNRCELRIARFDVRKDAICNRTSDEGRVLVTGNRCERGALMNGATGVRRNPLPNLLKYKRSLISSYGNNGGGMSVDSGASGLRVGIPKALALYESYPFWKTMFDELGVDVVDCADPCDSTFKAGMGCIPAEAMCYPAKSVYGQAVDLAVRGADVLFVPIIETAFSRFGLADVPYDQTTKTCPLVENMGSMLISNAAGSPLEGVVIALADLRGALSSEDICKSVAEALAEAGLILDLNDVRRAVKAASREYRRFLEKIENKKSEVIAQVKEGRFPAVLLIDHGYHAAEGISRNVDELIVESGYAVIEQGILGCACAGSFDVGSTSEESAFWYENEVALESVEKCKNCPDIQPVIMRSFGCGIDALAADRLRDRLRDAGSIYTELKIDQIADMAAMRIRLRSLAYAHRQRKGDSCIFEVTAPIEAYSTIATKPLTYEQRQRAREIEQERRDANGNWMTSDANKGTPSWKEWEGQGETATLRVFDDAVHVSIVAPQGYLIEFDVDIPDDLPAPGQSGKHAGPNLFALDNEQQNEKPRRTPYAHKYLGLYGVAGHTLKPGFSHADDPLNPDPAYASMPRSNPYAGATKPNYGPNYRKRVL